MNQVDIHPVLSQSAIITNSTADYLELKPVESGCHSCSGGCGIAHLSTLFGHKEKVLRLTNPGGYQEGERVEILLNEARFMHSTLTQYLLPLINMMLFVATFDLLYSRPMLNIMAAVIGLYLGVRLAAYWVKRIQGRFSANDLCIRNLSCASIDNMQPVKVIQT